MNVLCNPSLPQHTGTMAADNANLATLASLAPATYATIKPYEHVLAALFLIDQLRQDYYVGLFGIGGSYTVYTTGGKTVSEPYSDEGDLDGDGVDNVEEYVNVTEWGGWDDFGEATATPDWNGMQIPTASRTGLFILMVLLVTLAPALVRKHARRPQR